MSTEESPRTGAQREAKFQRNLMLENLLKEFNEALVPAQRILLDRVSLDAGDHPLIFIFGPLRSGTTLFMQWLASTEVVAYPTNLLSRFYGAPLVGAMVQLMIADTRYQFRDELTVTGLQNPFTSENGKTRGILSPNEFWYFWRRFLPFDRLDWLPDDELLRRVNTQALYRELVGLTAAFGKPFALKCMILNYNIPFLSKIFSNALFVQIHRNPVENVASVLEARKRQLGSEEVWYSFKIREYDELCQYVPLKQCAGQVYYINRAVSAGMSKLPESSKLIIQYEDFCENPASIYLALSEKLKLDSEAHRYSGREAFDTRVTAGQRLREEILEALEFFEKKEA